jgi:hypothetical protein
MCSKTKAQGGFLSPSFCHILLRLKTLRLSKNRECRTFIVLPEISFHAPIYRPIFNIHRFPSF